MTDDKKPDPRFAMVALEIDSSPETSSGHRQA